MHMRVLAAAAVAASIGSAGLTGCSSSPATTVYHTPALQTNGGRATARSMVETSIIATESSNGLAVPGGVTPASAIRIVRNVVHRRLGILAAGASTGACTNGTKQSQVTNSDGSVTTTTDLYYDSACTTLENEEVITVAQAVTSTTTASGTLTTYNRAGTVTSSHVLALGDALPSGSTTETITLTDNAAASIGGTTTAQLGITCVGAPNAVTMTCTAAHQGTTAGSTTGEALTDTTTAGSSGAQNSTTFSASFFLGSAGIAVSGTTWGVTNVSSYNSGTGTFSFSSAGTTGSGTITLADTLYTYSETGTLAAAGLALTIVENPNEAVTAVTPIATAAVDAGGNGAMTYTDGTVEAIWGGLFGPVTGTLVPVTERRSMREDGAAAG